MLAKSPPLPPVVHVKDGEVFANSKDVAEYFEKRHDHVLEKIRETIAEVVVLKGPEFS